MKERYLVCYDIADPKRLRRVAALLEGFGQRIQKSVFECELEPHQLRALQAEVLRRIRTDEDAVQYLRLCARDVRRIVHDGTASAFERRPYDIV
jgi:CRISPR-associated protein Cas2